MKVLPIATATLLAAFIGPALATDYHPPFPPLVTLGGKSPILYPEFPVEMLVTEQQSGNQFGLVLVYAKPGDGPPENMLLEYKLTETFYVISGQFRFHVGDDTYDGGPGTVVVVPPNVPHSFSNVGTDVGKVLDLYTPVDGAHGTGFFTMWADQVTRSPESIAKLNEAYGIKRPAP